MGSHMKVLLACSFSGIEREAFRAQGYDAWSCDILPAEDGSRYHIQGDVRHVLDYGWDLMVAHPPCNHLASSGARWFKDKVVVQAEAIDFVKTLMDAPIFRIAIENPIGILSTKIRKPDQIIQPWQYGHGECKATCWWLKNLPLLTPTDVVAGREQRIHKMPGGRDQGKNRGRAFRGIVDAEARQWGDYAYTRLVYEVTPTEFARKVDEVCAADPRMDENLTAHPVSVFARTFLAADGRAGVAVTPTAELVNLFNGSDIKGLGHDLVETALSVGAHHLNAFDGPLTGFYERHGFRVVRREANWSPGRPDVVFMEIPF